MRSTPGDDSAGGVVLVGVVHDHPASVARVHSVVDALNPDVVALEVPNLAVPLYEYYAAEEPQATEGPIPGGEVTAAVRGAPDADAVGIDVPGFGAATLLARYVRSESPSVETLSSLFDRMTAVTRHAVYCRLAAAVMAYTTHTVAAEDGVEYDCPVDATPAEQASHEQRAVDRSTSLLGAVETPASMAAFDHIREVHMARRIDALREEGTVVGVVGFDHLDAVHARVRSA